MGRRVFSLLPGAAVARVHLQNRRRRRRPRRKCQSRFAFLVGSDSPTATSELGICSCTIVGPFPAGKFSSERRRRVFPCVSQTLAFSFILRSSPLRESKSRSGGAVPSRCSLRTFSVINNTPSPPSRCCSRRCRPHRDASVVPSVLDHPVLTAPQMARCCLIGLMRAPSSHFVFFPHRFFVC